MNGRNTETGTEGIAALCGLLPKARDVVHVPGLPGRLQRETEGEGPWVPKIKPGKPSGAASSGEELGLRHGRTGVVGPWGTAERGGGRSRSGGWTRGPDSGRELLVSPGSSRGEGDRARPRPGPRQRQGEY